MMSKKQWFVLLCVYVVYLLMGASVFHEVERREELKGRIADKKERIEIEALLIKHYVPHESHTQDEIFEKLTTYCGKPLNANMSDIEPPLKWDFYHSIFFVITVVSTIGYGNLAPTTTLTRIFMIFYGIIGIPMNGIVIITLGDFFGKSFLKLYDRWKTLRVQHALATLGLVGQIVLYLIPGFTFFIFLPSIFIMVFEGWAYDVAVAYAFVTLTTIGFGDYVAGLNENGYGETLFMTYKIFLLVWIISGLGYIVMVLGFVSTGMRSKKMHAIEHKIAHNIKKTNNKIREELRTVLNEYLLLRVKRVYRDKFVYIPNKCHRSQSCPDLTIYRNMMSPTMARKRAQSTCISNRITPEISRNRSDTDLNHIDKEKTFRPSAAILEPSQLLLRVVNALGNYEMLHSSDSSGSASNDSLKLEGVDIFPQNEILASENYGSGWSIGNEKLSVAPRRINRPRAASECKNPIREKLNMNTNDLTWYGPSATKRLQELREQTMHSTKNQTKTLPPLLVPIPQPQSLFTRLRNTFRPSRDEEKPKSLDIERQDVYPQEAINDFNPEALHYVRQTQGRPSTFSLRETDSVLEHTSIAEFIRALTAISVPELEDSPKPKRKFGTASLTPPNESVPPRTRHPSLFPSRRSSLLPASQANELRGRRFSLRPTEPRDLFPPPPPYCEFPQTNSNMPLRKVATKRKFSLRAVAAATAAMINTDHLGQKRDGS